MSEENVEIVRRMYEAWNRRYTEILQYLDPEVELFPGIQPPGEETHYHGHAGVSDWIRNVTDAWVAVTVEPKETFEIASDRILALDRWRFRGREDIEVDEQLPTAYTFRSGLIVRVDGFTNKAEAFNAVGLSE